MSCRAAQPAAPHERARGQVATTAPGSPTGLQGSANAGPANKPRPRRRRCRDTRSRDRSGWHGCSNRFTNLSCRTPHHQPHACILACMNAAPTRARTCAASSRACELQREALHSLTHVVQQGSCRREAGQQLHVDTWRVRCCRLQRPATSHPAANCACCCRCSPGGCQQLPQPLAEPKCCCCWWRCCVRLRCLGCSGRRRAGHDVTCCTHGPRRQHSLALASHVIGGERVIAHTKSIKGALCGGGTHTHTQPLHACSRRARSCTQVARCTLP
jgi:hypothetical protein